MKKNKNILLSCVRFLGVKLGVRKWARTVHFILLTVDWGRKWLVDFKAGKTQPVSFDRSKKHCCYWCENG